MALATGARAEGTPSDVNGLWNDSDGNVGLWITRPGQSCGKEFRAEMPFLVVGLPVGANGKLTGKAMLKDINLCALFEKKNLQYTGVYDFFLKDGRRLSGKFKAEFCKDSTK